MLQRGESSSDRRGGLSNPKSLIDEPLRGGEVPILDREFLDLFFALEALQELKKLIGIELLCPSGMAPTLGVKRKILGHDRTEGKFCYFFVRAGLGKEVRDILRHARLVYGTMVLAR